MYTDNSLSERKDASREGGRCSKGGEQQGGPSLRDLTDRVMSGLSLSERGKGERSHGKGKKLLK